MSECVEVTQQPLKTLKEKKCSVILVNDDHLEYKIVRVDGCEIVGDEERCDYLAILGNQGWFIELKGSDTIKAIGQLENTVRILGSKFECANFTFVIVSTRAPAISNFQKRAKLAKARFGKKLLDVKLKCRRLEVIIS